MEVIAKKPIKLTPISLDSVPDPVEDDDDDEEDVDGSDLRIQRMIDMLHDPITNELIRVNNERNYAKYKIPE